MEITPNSKNVELAKIDIDLFLSSLFPVLVGQEEAIRSAVYALLTDNHVFLLCPPGRGKTVLAKAFQNALGVSRSRIQGTPDLLPSDITGGLVPNLVTGELTFRRGPLFMNIVHFDEINRASPKTQSALFEALEEDQITTGNETHELPKGHFVVLTGNLLESAGVYPLPDALGDRIAFCVKMVGLKPEDYKRAIFRQVTPVSEIKPVFDDGIDRILEIQQLVKAVAKMNESSEVGDQIVSFLFRLQRDSRLVFPKTSSDEKKLEASVRMGQDLLDAAAAHAVACGRSNILWDDVAYVATAVLAHRLVLRNAFNDNIEAVIAEMLTREV